MLNLYMTIMCFQKEQLMACLTKVEDSQQFVLDTALIKVLKCPKTSISVTEIILHLYALENCIYYISRES